MPASWMRVDFADHHHAGGESQKLSKFGLLGLDIPERGMPPHQARSEPGDVVRCVDHGMRYFGSKRQAQQAALGSDLLSGH